jgi:hypothetical protein
VRRRRSRLESERQALEAALKFYATPANYEPVVVPNDLIAANERMIVSVAGAEYSCTTYQSGPAVDGGAHARYVLGLLRAGTF